MDLASIENSSIEELLCGYKQSADGYECLWCGKTFSREAAAETHVADYHKENERFGILLGADSILKFTPEEKALCALLFNEQDQKSIAGKMGMSHSAVRVKRSNLYYGEYIRSKIAYLLFEMIYSNQPKRAYTRKEKDDLHKLSHIPYFVAQNLNVTGFAPNKEELHTSAALSEHVHATVIILVAKRLSNGELHFLTCDKSGYNMENFTERIFPIRNQYDCLGGHVERQDIIGGEYTGRDSLAAKDTLGGHRIKDEWFLRAAQRELKEECYLRKASLAPEKLQYLFRINYKSSDPASGRYNNEISSVYLYIIPQEADARVREEYIDTIGMTVKLELPIRYFTFNELVEAFRSPESFCDGLGRVVSHLIENPDEYERMKEMRDLL